MTRIDSQTTNRAQALLSQLDSHHPQVQQSVIGVEQQPTLIIDNLMPQAASLIGYALEQNNLVQAPGLYPGLRSPAPPLYCAMLK